MGCIHRQYLGHTLKPMNDSGLARGRDRIGNSKANSHFRLTEVTAAVSSHLKSYRSPG